MTDKHVRGELLVFHATPMDDDENSVMPATVKLYLNYKHADGTTTTDAPIDMSQATGGTYETAFDTKVCEPAPLFWSIRTTAPPAAADGKIQIIANNANPDP